jgi:hypothetical protein
MAIENAPLAQHYRNYMACAEQLRRARKAMIGKRVEYVPLTRRPVEPVRGTIRDVSAAGFKVRWDGRDTAEAVHPESVRYLR